MSPPKRSNVGTSRRSIWPGIASAGMTLHCATNSSSSITSRRDGSSSATMSRPLRTISGSVCVREARANGSLRTASASTGKCSASTIG